ncbi:MAG: ADP-ribosylglycohydrolase family protein [Atribacterota bacterium]|nr:ADP-ribosylglycohydrolase family protein [Atribacterota bacterium]
MIKREMTEREKNIANQWLSVMKSGNVEHRVIEGVYALENKGYDVSKAKSLIIKGENAYNNKDFNRLLKIISMIKEESRRAPKMKVDCYKPETFEDILNACVPLVDLSRFPQKVDSDVWYEKVYGGWYGKCIGVSLGDPVAGWESEKIRDKYGIITDYVKKPSTKNDDVTYPIVLLHTIEEYGPEFTSRDLGYEWVEHLMPEEVCTAEFVALENIKNGIIPPYSAKENNPFNLWIGAQMRGEVNGFIAPGNPRVAVDFAYRDAVVSHITEAVYSEMFNAAVISAAFVEDDINELIKIGLSYVPRSSEFYNIIDTTCEWCKDFKNSKEVLAKIEETYASKYHWIHTFPNIANVIMALILGEGDFGKSICISANSGIDADCSTGQVGATLGVLIGEKNIPIKWKEPLNNTIEAYLYSFEKMKISELTDWTLKIGKIIAEKIK